MKKHGKLAYSILGYGAFIFLVFLPILYLAIGWNGYDGFIVELYDVIVGNVDFDEAILKKIIIEIMSIGIISVMYISPFELNNGMKFSLHHIVNSINKAFDNKDKDVELYKTHLWKALLYLGAYLGSFLLYLFIIREIVSTIEDGTFSGLIMIIGLAIQGIAIILANHFAILFLNGIDPAPDVYKDGQTSYSAKIDTDAQNKASENGGFLGTFLLLFVTFVALSLSSWISGIAIDQIEKNEDIKATLNGEIPSNGFLGHGTNTTTTNSSGAGSIDSGSSDTKARAIEIDY